MGGTRAQGRWVWIAEGGQAPFFKLLVLKRDPAVFMEL